MPRRSFCFRDREELEVRLVPFTQLQEGFDGRKPWDEGSEDVERRGDFGCETGDGGEDPVQGDRLCAGEGGGEVGADDIEDGALFKALIRDRGCVIYQVVLLNKLKPRHLPRTVDSP